MCWDCFMTFIGLEIYLLSITNHRKFFLEALTLILLPGNRVKALLRFYCSLGFLKGLVEVNLFFPMSLDNTTQLQLQLYFSLPFPKCLFYCPWKIVSCCTTTTTKYESVSEIFQVRSIFRENGKFFRVGSEWRKQRHIAGPWHAPSVDVTLITRCSSLFLKIGLQNYFYNVYNMLSH